MSAFDISCPHCGQSLEADDDLVGETLDCPACGKPIEISSPASVTAVNRPVAYSGTGRQWRLPTAMESNRMRQSVQPRKKVNIVLGAFVAVVVLFLAGGAAFFLTGKKSGTEVVEAPSMSTEQTDEGGQEVSEQRAAVAAPDSQHRVRTPTPPERIFKEGLDALLGQNGQTRDVVKAFRLFQDADRMGCAFGGVGMAHIWWSRTKEEERALDEAGFDMFSFSRLAYENWKYAAEIKGLRIARCEWGLHRMRSSGSRAEGLALVKQAASEGSMTAQQFLRQISEAGAGSSLSPELVLTILCENEEVLQALQKSCELDLAIDYLLSLRE